MLYYLFAVIIISASFLYYGAPFFHGFDSDHAIHVLMARDFSWPNDVYYWGQNRLGSLLPLLTHAAMKAFTSVHPLFLTAVVQWILLLIPTILISSFIKNRWLKLSLFLFIFFPFNEFYLLLLPGHPYSGQYFCGTLCIYFLYRYYKEKDSFAAYSDIKRVTLLFAAQLFYALGVWVSEFNAVVIFIPLLFIAVQKGRVNLSLVPGMLLFCILPLLVIFILKSFTISDPFYNKTFFFDAESLGRQMSNLLRRLHETFLFGDGLILRNLNYFLLLALVIFILIEAKKHAQDKSGIVRPLLITGLLSFLCLFFSQWNLRGEISAKYYTPVYILLLCALLFYADGLNKTKMAVSVFACFLLISCASLPEHKYVVKEHPGGVHKAFSDFKKLPKGTLIGNYWDVYVINSVAWKNLKALSYDDEFVRNSHQVRELMRAPRFYFLADEELEKRCKNDTIRQFGVRMVYSGKSYTCNGTEVRLFYRE